MSTISHALRDATARLATTSPTPRLDAEVLLAHTLGISRAKLLVEGDQQMADAVAQRFEEFIARRVALEPVAYIVGHKEFYGREFMVDPRVLVPRPETELLVELALRWSAQQPHPPKYIADIGTGSGCIAVTLAVHLPHTHIFAVDLSRDALDVAQHNAALHHVAERITLLQGDGCAPLPHRVDLIATNPPYTILNEVDPNVQRWEPHLALDGGGASGFELPAELLRQIPAYLQPSGSILMEIGAWQGALALHTARAVFPDAPCQIYQDLAGRDRVLAVGAGFEPALGSNLP